MSFDFNTLTKKQQDVLGYIAINQDEGHDPKTTAALEELGLIEGYEEEIFGKGDSPIDRMPMVVRRFAVPLPIHMAWCFWCSENISDEDEDELR